MTRHLSPRRSLGLALGYLLGWFGLSLHLGPLLRRHDLLDRQAGVGLAVPRLRPLPRLRLVLEYRHLGAAALADHLRRYLRAGHSRAAHRHPGTVGEEEDIRQLDLIALIGIETLDLNDRAFFDAVLLTAAAYDRVNRTPPRTVLYSVYL